MALTADQKTAARQALENYASANGLPINYTKALVNAAFDALDDWWVATGRPGAGSAIEAAAPGAFSAQQKQKIGKAWLAFRFGQE